MSADYNFASDFDSLMRSYSLLNATRGKVRRVVITSSLAIEHSKTSVPIVRYSMSPLFSNFETFYSWIDILVKFLARGIVTELFCLLKPLVLVNKLLDPQPMGNKFCFSGIIVHCKPFATSLEIGDIQTSDQLGRKLLQFSDTTREVIIRWGDYSDGSD